MSVDGRLWYNFEGGALLDVEAYALMRLRRSCLRLLHGPDGNCIHYKDY